MFIEIVSFIVMFDVCIGFYFLKQIIYIFSFVHMLQRHASSAGWRGTPCARANVNSHVFPVAV